MWSIMFLPNEVVEEEISRQGILPMVAPVNPYTLLALTCGHIHKFSGVMFHHILIHVSPYKVVSVH